MKTDVKGIWMSEFLDEIPNYNSNFTNWVDCVCYKGQIKIDISDEIEGRLIMKIHVPVIYYGGIKGYACINKFSVDESKNLILGLNTQSLISSYIFMGDNVLIMRNLFGKQREFSRLRE